jgi:hypothetical protein
MSHSKNQIKIPTKEGLAEARKKLKEMRRKEPSPELVKIIADIAEQQDKEEQEKDIAARPRSSGMGV